MDNLGPDIFGKPVENTSNTNDMVYGMFASTDSVTQPTPAPGVSPAKIKVIGVGGFASSNQSFVGTLASNYIEENFFATKVFFSSRGVTVNGGILDSNEAECGIKKCMIKNSDQKFYLCDKSKIGRIGFAKLADFSEIDHFITEKPLNEDIAKALSDLDVKVTEV